MTIEQLTEDTKDMTEEEAAEYITALSKNILDPTDLEVLQLAVEAWVEKMLEIGAVLVKRASFNDFLILEENMAFAINTLFKPEAAKFAHEQAERMLKMKEDLASSGD